MLVSPFAVSGAPSLNPGCSGLLFEFRLGKISSSFRLLNQQRRLSFRKASPANRQPWLRWLLRPMFHPVFFKIEFVVVTYVKCFVNITVNPTKKDASQHCFNAFRFVEQRRVAAEKNRHFAFEITQACKVTFVRPTDNQDRIGLRVFY